MVDIHVENFIDSYEYLGAQRGWFEQIGFWGAPGTPAPGATPVGIKAINVPSLPSMAAYSAAYPRGYDEPYPWTPPAGGGKPTAATGAGAGAAAAWQGMTQSATLTLGLVFTMGVGLGLLLALLCVRGTSRGGYEEVK